MCNLKETPGDADGVQVGFAKGLKDNITKLQQNGILQKGDKVKIKLNGDGTNNKKRLKVVNFAYMILNEKQKAMREKGTYVLAVFKTTESYDN